MFASLFQEYGFHRVPLEGLFFMSILHGPSSMSKPIEDEHPGPTHMWRHSVLIMFRSHNNRLTSVDPHHDIVWQCPSDS